MIKAHDDIPNDVDHIGEYKVMVPQSCERKDLHDKENSLVDTVVQPPASLPDPNVKPTVSPESLGTPLSVLRRSQRVRKPVVKLDLCITRNDRHMTSQALNFTRTGVKQHGRYFACSFFSKLFSKLLSLNCPFISFFSASFLLLFIISI